MISAKMPDDCAGFRAETQATGEIQAVSAAELRMSLSGQASLRRRCPSPFGVPQAMPRRIRLVLGAVHAVL